MSRLAADTWFSGKQALIKARVEARANALGQRRFPQILRTHSAGAIPADGASVLPDRLGDKTTDNGDQWSQLGVPSAGFWPAPCALEVHNYGGPRGQGYVILLWVREGSTLYLRRVNVGPETSFDVAWVAV